MWADEDKDMLDELDRHLSNLKRQLFITSWSSREIRPGRNWKEEIDTQLNTAHLILLLISSNFMASEYCYSIGQRALERHRTGSVRVIPVLLRPVDWEDAPFNVLKVLPNDNRPVTRWRDHDEAWQSIVQGIRSTIKDLTNPSEVKDVGTFSNANLQRLARDEDKPTTEKPMLICLATDVSDSMKQPIIDHTRKTIARWVSIQNAIEHFVHLGVSWVKDPETQNVLPLYHLLAYGFGFRELMYGLGWRKKRGGPVRDWLAHPNLSSLPSALDLSEHWNDYKKHFLSHKEFTGDFFGSTPMCLALATIRDRIREECNKQAFTFPVLLLIISDGLIDNGENPLLLINELHSMGVLTLSCYLADKDVLASRQLYREEQEYWSNGAKLMFRCASTLHIENYVTQAIFDYLADSGWNPQEGVRLFAQVNQTEGLENFLEILLSGTADERRE